MNRQSIEIAISMMSYFSDIFNVCMFVIRNADAEIWQTAGFQALITEEPDVAREISYEMHSTFSALRAAGQKLIDETRETSIQRELGAA